MNIHYLDFFVAIESMEDALTCIADKTSRYDPQIDKLRKRIDVVVDETLFHTSVFGWTPVSHVSSGFDSLFKAYQRFAKTVRV